LAGFEVTAYGRFWVTAKDSYFMFYKKIPSTIGFGQMNTQGQMYFWVPPR